MNIFLKGRGERFYEQTSPGHPCKPKMFTLHWRVLWLK